MANYLIFDGGSYVTAPTLGNLLTATSFRISSDNVLFSPGTGYLWSQAGDGNREFGLWRSSDDLQLYIGGSNFVLMTGAQVTAEFGSTDISGQLEIFVENLGPNLHDVTLKRSGVTIASLSGITSIGARVDGCLFRFGARAADSVSGSTTGNWLIAANDTIGDTDVYIDGVLTRRYIMPSSGITITDSESSQNATVRQSAGDGSEWGSDGAAAPTITNINTNNEIAPGATATLTGTNLTGATGFNIGSEAQTAFTVVNDTTATFTVVRGGNPYNQNLTGTLLHPDGNQTITVQQVEASGELAVTAASPNNTDPASFWAQLVDTVTGDPITFVDGDQGLAYDFAALSTVDDPFSIAGTGNITAGNTGTFKAIYWRQSEGIWSAEQTITFEVEDTVGPVVQSLSVPTSGTYGAGDALSFTVNWNEAATVTGTPALNLSIGGSARQANYASGTGTAALVFSYTVQSGDLDTDGITVTSLTLDGGTIQDSAGNNATLTLNSVGDTSGVLVDGVSPVISINPLTTLDTSPIVSGSAGDATSLTLVVTGVGTYTPTPSGGTWSQQLPTLALGEYPMTLNGTDAAGNAAVEASATLSVVDELSNASSILQPVLKSILSPIFEDVA